MRALASVVVALSLIHCTLALPSGQGGGGADSIRRHGRAAVDDEVEDIFDSSRFSNGTVLITSATGYFAGALETYYSIPRSVIDTIRPGPLPYELFLPTLSGALDGFVNEGGRQETKRQVGPDLDVQGNIQSIATDYVTWLVPVLVVSLLSLLLAICFPCVGLFFCCCRLCGKCGGRTYHYRAKHQTVKCIILSVILLLSSTLQFIAIILGFLSNDKISTTLNSYTSSVDAAIQDGVSYINNTLDEVGFIATDQLESVLDSVTSDIEGVAAVLGGSLETSLEREASPFLNSTNSLLSYLDGLQSDFESVNTSLSDLSGVAVQLNSSFNELKEALNNLSMMCMGDPTCLSLVPSSMDINLEFDENELSVSDALSSFEDASISDVRGLVDNATQLFNNISGLLEDNIGDFDLPVNQSQFESVSSIIESARATVNEVVGENGTISSIRSAILDDGDYYIGLYDMYRYGLTAALFVLIFLIWMVFVTGLSCGAFGYSSKALPYERSHVSHCGARLLLFGTTLSFLFGGLLLVLASFMYFGSTAIQKICNDLAPPEYVTFERIFDDRQVWNGRTLVGNILYNQLGIDSNISVTTFLRECDSNSPIYEALQVESFLDVEELLSNFTNITNQLDLGDMDFGSVLNFSSSDFIPTSVRQTLEDLQDTINGSVNLTAYADYLSRDPLTFVLEDIFNNLTVIATHFSDNMMESMANYTIEVRNNLVGTAINSSIQEFTEIRNSLVGNLNDINSRIESQEIAMQVQSIFVNLDQFLNETGAVVTNEVEAYIDRILGHITGFIDFTLNAVRNEIGRCRPLTAAYSGLHIAFCSKTLDGLNGFWFSVGWYVTFLIIMLISGAVLTNYIRRSPPNVHPITKDDDIGYVDTVISNTRIVSGTGDYSNQHDAVELTRLPNIPHTRATHW